MKMRSTGLGRGLWLLGCEYQMAKERIKGNVAYFPAPEWYGKTPKTGGNILRISHIVLLKDITHLHFQIYPKSSFMNSSLGTWNLLPHRSSVINVINNDQDPRLLI